MPTKTLMKKKDILYGLIFFLGLSLFFLSCSGGGSGGSSSSGGGGGVVSQELDPLILINCLLVLRRPK